LAELAESVGRSRIIRIRRKGEKEKEEEVEERREERGGERKRAESGEKTELDTRDREKRADVPARSRSWLKSSCLSLPLETPLCNF
jgi:hypothetical protein